MDAIALLKEDHEKVKKLMDDLEKTTERGVKSRSELFSKLVTELKVHERIEEEIFYPAVRERAETKQVEELIAESYEEHHFVDIVAGEIAETPFEAEEWAAKFKVMKENVEHHAVEEEEGKLFPKVRRAFSQEELEELGARMLELKETAQAELQEQEAGRPGRSG
jgi:hemerythrin superfamily protein